MHRHSAMAYTAICFAVAGGTLVRPTAAQDSSVRAPIATRRDASMGAIGGTVVDTGRVPMPLVQIVMIDAPFSRTRTNSVGVYRMDSVSVGFHLLRFRRIGLMPTTIPVTVGPDGITEVDVALAAIPQKLAAVTIQDSLGEVLRLPKGVVERMRNGMGSYITAADIAKRHAIRTSQILQYVAGAEVSKEGQVNSTRGVISIKTPGCEYGLPIYIDEQRVSDPHIASDTLHANNLVDYVQPGDIALIEVYRGPAELPETLPQDKCGGIFIWTKR